MALSLSPFELVSNNLSVIGALSLAQFISLGPHELDKPDAIPELTHHNSASVPSGSKDTPARLVNLSVDLSQNIARLHHAFQHTFGQSNGLKFEFLEQGVEKKQCILIITRPDGTTRSYQSEPIFRRKNDAKAQVASFAIEHGALDFITRGESDSSKAKKGILLAPLEDAPPTASTSKLSSAASSTSFIPGAGTPMPHYREIESCCKKWHSMSVYPSWFDFTTGNSALFTANTHGAILKIQLAPHCYRVYSCEPIFSSASLAREDCAKLAVSEGVLEFIQHGNGRTKPLHTGVAQSPQPRSLQLFFEELPRPFEEGFEDKTAAEVNSPGWLNTVLAGAKGARFSTEFYFVTSTSDTLPPRLVHGCLLRLTRPEECRSYFAEPQFGSTNEAKAGVCLLAMSQGVGRYIREIGAAVEARVAPQMRAFVQNVVFPALAAEGQRLGGVAPRFESSAVQDAFGCTMYVALKPNAGASERREYWVPAQYRSKADAKTAVVYHAAEQGVVDFLRYEGRPVPAGTAPAFSVDEEGAPRLAPSSKKRKKEKEKEKGAARSGGPPAKKQKMGRGSALPVPTGTTWSVPPKLGGGTRVVDAARWTTAVRRVSPAGSLEDGELVEEY